MIHYLLAFLGAGLGGVFRLALSSGVQGLFSSITFPVGTLVVNLIGCLLIGVTAYLGETRAFFTPEVRTFFILGVLGGFTTFSTFGYETFQLLRTGEYLMAILNAVLPVVFGILFAAIGYSLAKLI